jgi:hypothetical protein
MIHGSPVLETKFAKPRPNTTVLALLTTIEPYNLYVPGVSTRCRPDASFAFIVLTESDYVAT